MTRGPAGHARRSRSPKNRVGPNGMVHLKRKGRARRLHYSCPFLRAVCAATETGGCHGGGTTTFALMLWARFGTAMCQARPQRARPRTVCAYRASRAPALMQRTAGQSISADNYGNGAQSLRLVAHRSRKIGRGEPPRIAQAGSKDFVGRYRSRQAGGSDWSMTEPCSA